MKKVLKNIKKVLTKNDMRVNIKEYLTTDKNINEILHKNQYKVITI